MSALALLLAAFARTPVTVKHVLGHQLPVSLPIIGCGDRIDVLAAGDEGKLEVVLDHVLVMGARGAHEDGEHVILFDLYLTAWQRYRLSNYDDLQVEFCGQ